MSGSTFPRVDSDVTAVGGEEPGSHAPVKYVVPPSLQKYLNTITYPFSSEQLEGAEDVAKTLGIAYSAGDGGMPRDFEWMGGPFGIAQLFIRRKVNDKKLQMEGFRFVTDRNTRILYEEDGLYAAGFIDTQVEPLSEDKLCKPIAGIDPLKPETDWAQWFRLFENALVSKPVPIDQWADVLVRHVDADLRTCVTNEMAAYRQANVPRRYLYAALRDFLLNSAGDKYHPMVYLDRVYNIKQGEFEAETLALKLNQLFTLYEAARKRAVFNFKRYPPISPSYAAWIYFSKLDKAIQQKIPAPSRVQPLQGRDDYTELILLARDAEQNLRSAGVLTQLPALTAAVTEKQGGEINPPILKLSKGKRERSMSPSQGKRVKREQSRSPSRASQGGRGGHMSTRGRGASRGRPWQAGRGGQRQQWDQNRGSYCSKLQGNN